MPTRPLVWLGSALDNLPDFPEDARRLAGYQLRRLQEGLLPDDWKPMTGVGPGVLDLRIHTGTEHRVFYLAKFAEAVYVLHAFEKRTQKTRESDLDLARSRYRALLQHRARSR
ncbi:MAG: type II toxin-antitoxin system RelE/ParE family toxin [Gemmatimonadota bacterium]